MCQEGTGCSVGTAGGYLPCARLEVEESTLQVHCFAGVWLNALSYENHGGAAKIPQCLAWSCLRGNVLLFKHMIIHSA